MVIRAAANYVVDQYVADRERGGKLPREQLDNIDLPDIPSKTFLITPISPLLFLVGPPQFGDGAWARR